MPNVANSIIYDVGLIIKADSTVFVMTSVATRNFVYLQSVADYPTLIMMSVIPDRVKIKQLTEITGVSESTIRRKLNDLKRTDRQYRDRVSMIKEGKTRVLLVDKDYILPFLSQYIPTPEPEPTGEDESAKPTGNGTDNGLIGQTLSVFARQLEAQNKVIFGLQEQLSQQTKLNFVFQEQLRQLKAPTNSEMQAGEDAVSEGDVEPIKTDTNQHRTMESVNSDNSDGKKPHVVVKANNNRQLLFYRVTIVTLLAVVVGYLAYVNGGFTWLLSVLGIK